MNLIDKLSDWVMDNWADWKLAHNKKFIEAMRSLIALEDNEEFEKFIREVKDE